MTENYTLQAHIPYEAPDHLFYGSLEDLKAFISTNLGTSTYRFASGREMKSPTICGHLLDDITIYIDGPDVRDLIKEVNP